MDHVTLQFESVQLVVTNPQRIQTPFSLFWIRWPNISLFCDRQTVTDRAGENTEAAQELNAASPPSCCPRAASKTVTLMQD